MKVDNFHLYSDYLSQSGYTTNASSFRLPSGKFVHRQVIVETRKLSYQFYPHFHPYVTELIDRLIEKSVPGLQSADTEYRTLLKLSSPITIDKQTVNHISLADGTIIRKSDGSPIQLSGNKVLKLDATQPKIETSIAIELTKDEHVIVPQNTVALEFPSNREISISTDAEATLVYGKPTPILYKEIFSLAQYNPNLELVPNTPASPHPVKDLDFTSSGAYSAYNWELFFHVPMTIALHLSKNQRFEEAMQWFHYIFDPTDDSDGLTPERFWKVKPFQYTDVKLIEDILINLSSNVDPALQQETINSINAWKANPFHPHVIARYRQSAYMFKTIMAYLDNLLNWGDSLFRQDTGESINEAAQLYILAANILGPRPQAIPKKSSVRPQTYANLRKDLDQFSNALREAEIRIPFATVSLPTNASEIEQTVNLRSLGKDLYFCIPHNEKLLSYWDAVADRLFKIRNSLNLQGIFRQIPLFDPPIDPALLAKAAASGLDVGAIVNGINQPLPLVRFQVLVQKATEICQEVKSLGNNLLSAMEKEDNEALAILRSHHEQIILSLAESVKYSQWQEAIKAREGLEVSLKNAVQHYIYYETQLGKKDNEIKIPKLDSLDLQSLGDMNFVSKEPDVGLRNVDIDIAKNLNDSGGKIISSHEQQEFQHLEMAQNLHEEGSTLSLIAKVLALIPDFGLQAEPMGVGAAIVYGGKALSSELSIAADASSMSANRSSYEASKSSRIGSYARREQEWAYQSNLAAGEISQIFKQLRASQIREAIAEREWKNHQQQIQNAQEIEQFLKGEETQIGNQKHKKVSTQGFYTWMKREVKGLYGQCFQFAFDVAKKAERALQHELGNPSLNYLQFGYLSGKEGLLAGEKLYLDIKRMEMAYHDLNQREYELTKHISLLQVDPLALLQLRTTGRCTVRLPEELFDMDCPGHYFRRIKNVALSIPCVTGPYTSVNCTLTLLKSSIRKTTSLGEGYARVGDDAERFSDYFGSLQSIVTSSGQNDSGLFETNLRDERYLPFEGSGVISEWQLQLPANPSKSEPCQFDYDTISDAILHIRYTAREAGGLLRNGAITNFKTGIEAAQAIGSVRLFSIRHEFPTEWAKFKNGDVTPLIELIITLKEEHYPFWSKGNVKTIKSVNLFVNSEQAVSVSWKADGSESQALAKDPSLGNLWAGKLANLPLTLKPISIMNEKFTLYFSDRSMDNMWLAIAWGKED